MSNLGGGENNFPITTSSGGNITNAYYSKKGDDFYAIIDKLNNSILKYGEKDYNKYKEIEDCKPIIIIEQLYNNLEWNEIIKSYNKLKISLYSGKNIFKKVSG